MQVEGDIGAFGGTILDAEPVVVTRARRAVEAVSELKTGSNGGVKPCSGNACVARDRGICTGDSCDVLVFHSLVLLSKALLLSNASEVKASEVETKSE